MAPKNAALLDVDTQQEASSSELPYSRLVQPGGTKVIGHTERGTEIHATVGRMAETAKIAGRPVDQQYANLLAGARKRHERTGIQAATILNFLPIPLVVNSPMEDLKVRIAPAPAPGSPGDPFSFHVWTTATFEVVNLGEGQKMPWDFMPVMMADAFADEYRDFGGVVQIDGIPDQKTLELPKVVQAIADGKEKMITWMVSKVEEANGFWNSPNHQESGNIVELHRVCASCLKDLGVIDELPDWIIVTRNLKEVAKKCPLCATQPQMGAVECMVCHYVFDPEAAYLKGAITEEDPALERLTREQVEALGISAYVAETSDEKPARLKRGAVKPLSLSASRALQQQVPSVGAETVSAL